MRNGATVRVIIPALNEEASIGNVLADIPEWVDEVVVADNGSTDATREVAENLGATVVSAARRGYGSACLVGIAALAPCDVVVFLDGDYSDYPEQMARLVDPIAEGNAEMVIGSRVRGEHEPGALTPQQRFGNGLACFLIRMFWNMRYTDLGPFRAIRHDTLLRLGMADPDYGWTVEMQIKAALRGVKATEVPVDYRKRIGISKVSGTIRGVVGAGYKILSTIFIAAARHHLTRTQPPKGLVLFTRYPVPGETKTRLIPALGPEGAAALQRKMTEHAVRTGLQARELDVEVRFTGADEPAMRDWLGTSCRFAEQGDGDLGDRMRRAFADAFESAHDRVVIMGIDCPDITPGVLDRAFHILEHHDIVLGPATDGGYYLVGLNAKAATRALPTIFESVAWGTEQVFGQTLEHVRRCGLRLGTLAPLDDVDRPEDIPVWERVDAPDKRPPLSVIIPTLNESDHIELTIANLVQHSDLEILVVDGGSTDDTVAQARALGVTVLEGAHGRATQMNLGAARAQGRSLVFLHADTTLPDQFADEVERILSDQSTALGAFRFAVDDLRWQYRLIAWGTNLRASLFKLPYGDQALFLRRRTFFDLGGFDNVPVMEDFRLVRRAARTGRIVLSPVAAVTSARRQHRVGPWRSVLYNQAMIAAHSLGVDPARLAQWRHGPRAND